MVIEMELPDRPQTFVCHPDDFELIKKQVPADKKLVPASEYEKPDMSIDAIINNVFEEGLDLKLELMAREVGGSAGQDWLTIKNYTHVPRPGQEIWGGSLNCIIEPGKGVKVRRFYKREGYTTLIEN